MEDEKSQTANIRYFVQEIKNAKAHLKKAESCLKAAKEINDEWEYNLDEEFKKAFDALNELLSYVITQKEDLQ